MSDIRKNLQVNQPNMENLPENNGWPTDDPLTDPSSPLQRKVTVGRNGDSMQKGTQTSQQAEGAHHRPEGSGSDQGTQPSQLSSERAPSPFKTSGYVSDPGGTSDPVITQAPNSEAAIGRANAFPTETTQQHDKAHKLPEGR